MRQKTRHAVDHHFRGTIQRICHHRFGFRKRLDRRPGQPFPQGKMDQQIHLRHIAADFMGGHQTGKPDPFRQTLRGSPLPDLLHHGPVAHKEKIQILPGGGKRGDHFHQFLVPFQGEQAGDRANDFRLFRDAQFTAQVFLPLRVQEPVQFHAAVSDLILLPFPDAGGKRLLDHRLRHRKDFIRNFRSFRFQSDIKFVLPPAFPGMKGKSVDRMHHFFHPGGMGGKTPQNTRFAAVGVNQIKTPLPEKFLHEPVGTDLIQRGDLTHQIRALHHFHAFRDPGTGKQFPFRSGRGSGEQYTLVSGSGKPLG